MFFDSVTRYTWLLLAPRQSLHVVNKNFGRDEFIKALSCNTATKNRWSNRDTEKSRTLRGSTGAGRNLQRKPLHKIRLGKWVSVQFISWWKPRSRAWRLAIGTQRNGIVHFTVLVLHDASCAATVFQKLILMICREVKWHQKDANHWDERGDSGRIYC